MTFAITPEPLKKDRDFTAGQEAMNAILQNDAGPAKWIQI